MLVYILLAFAAVVLAILVIAALQPADFSVTRSIRISAPPEAVFAEVNDFHHWEAWNPWGKIDPNMKQNYAGPPRGEGAEYRWEGNNKVGAGRMKLELSRPNERIQIRLDFYKPWTATNRALFTFASDGGQTVVTWTMTGRKNFVSKLFGLFMSMDKMIGGQFEKGLADLKSVSEAAPAV